MSTKMPETVAGNDTESGGNMGVKFVQVIGVLSVASIVLSGCSVKPSPLSNLDTQSFADDSLSRVVQDQEPVSGSIDLYEAMARAIKYNMDARVEAMESALRMKEVDLAGYSMLPKLVAASGYAGRNNTDAGSTSTRDGDVFSADLTLSWNILDFGLSYVRAKQAADKVLIQEEMKRKVVNATISDVRSSYWRAVSYERLVHRMRALEGRVQGALNDARQLVSSGNTSPIAALSYERELIQIQRELETLEGEMKVSKAQLAALMNVPPEQNFTLAIPKKRVDALNIASNYRELYRTALSNRPEMREIAYQLRVNDRELDAALLQLLPGFNLYAGANYDSNEFLASNSWLGWGAKASWNLMHIFSLPATKAKVEAQGTMLDARSLSVTMAVMTQVHVSRARFMQARKEFATASALARVQNKLLEQVRAETAAQRTSQQILIREEMNALVTEAKLDMAYANLQNAYANVYSSLGVDPFPADMNDNQPVKSMAQQLRRMWLERGEQPTLVLAKN